MDNKPSVHEKDSASDSIEKGGVTHTYARQTNKEFHFDEHDLDRVQRRLKQRHVQMIAIAGTIGTGLFLGSGGALANAGPLGALIAYALVGTVAYSSLCAVGEMSTWAPISGTFPHFAARWVDPALGFATGWNYFYTNAISTPSEITAAVILLTFWDHNVSFVVETQDISRRTFSCRFPNWVMLTSCPSPVMVCCCRVAAVTYCHMSSYLAATVISPLGLSTSPVRSVTKMSAATNARPEKEKVVCLCSACSKITFTQPVTFATRAGLVIVAGWDSSQGG